MAASDSTRELRQLVYGIIGAVAVGIMIAHIVGAENLYEPSRYAPPGSEKFGADRPDKPTRVWPSTRPEPTPFFSSNDRSRWATIRALVDQGTFVVGQRENFRSTAPPYGDRGIIFEDGFQSLDKVMNPETGEFFSSKPPLLTVVLAGEYWVLKHLFGWSIDRDRWPVVCTILITVNVLPFIAFLVLLARILEDWGETDFARLLVFALAALGTFLTTFSNTLHNHGPAAFAVFFALVPHLRKTPVTRWGLFASGFFAGLAAALDLPAAAFTAALFAPLLYMKPRQSLTYFLPGMLLPVAFLLACNYWALGRWLPAYSDFGGPWYNFAGSHWAKLDEVKAGKWHAGIDFAAESKLIYAFHLLLGHHGWFSLTPVWFIGLWGLVDLVRRSRPRFRSILARQLPDDERIFSLSTLGLMTAVISLVVFEFYIYKTNNYGGNTSGPRWLFWLIPLWLLATLHGAELAGRYRLGRILALIALTGSVLSVYYPFTNPWRTPWLQQLGERTGVVSYDRPPP